MSAAIEHREHDGAANHPNAVRVRAFLSPDATEWIVPSCPFCSLHHRHGSDGDPASAGLRVPHCLSIVPRRQDYYLIPDGPISAQAIRKLKTRDRKRLSKLIREVEQERREPGYLEKTLHW